MVLVLISVVLLHLCHVCHNVDVEAFCAIKCMDARDKHTICEYKCQEDPQRCKDFKHYPLNNRERQTMLDLHNTYRNKVASGKDTRGGNEAAKDMIALNYDVDIEVTTYCWSKRCDLGHDRCRRLAKYTSAGQNVFFQGGTVPIDAKQIELFNTSVTEWYEEIEFTSKQLLAKYQKVEKKIGHFTQIIWATTEFMGCSRATWTEKDTEFPYKYHLVCNYSPAGNFFDAPVYQFGTGCTPPRTANDVYPGLCGETKKLKMDDIDENDGKKHHKEGKDDTDDAGEPPVFNEHWKSRRNVTGRPWQRSASQINGRSALLPWTCLVLYMSGRLCYPTTIYYKVAMIYKVVGIS